METISRTAHCTDSGLVAQADAVAAVLSVASLDSLGQFQGLQYSGRIAGQRGQTLDGMMIRSLASPGTPGRVLAN
jgi:hypothetical protein